ncbi:helix-turn-helix domain-containing protein [Telluribacter sp. SYSU D00476]|uniref:helix-turn-helix domain-containing protein n=1 Tax=Telluribacter sp. SYSU D00476 TaxID=2811430 RepID=UPI001FF1BE12|nr:helix-turn-helix domain-containing protein [Telluribacter sp. SYSU D00476]
MISEIYLPKTRLAEAVDCFYINRAESFETRSWAMPMVQQEVFFNLGDVFEVCDPSGTYPITQKDSWVSGIRTKPLQVYTQGRHLTVGILFKPWGLYQAFGINARELSNQSVEVSVILGTSFSQFVQEQARLLPPGEFLAALEQYLLRSYQARRIKNQVLEQVEKLDYTGFEKGTMSQLARQLHLSPKTVIDTFNTTLGISPVRYFHLRMVNRALRQIRQHPERSLTEIGLELGFFDQAHFIRVFKSFCGMSPRAYRKSLQVPA